MTISSSASSRPLTSNHPQYGTTTHSSHRQLLSGGELLLYLDRYGARHAIEVPAMGTVDDLYQLAAERLGLSLGRFELSFQGQSLSERQQALADTGVSSECVVSVTMPPNDIDYLLSTFEFREPSEKMQEAMHRIRTANEEVKRTGSQDIRAVVQLINSIEDQMASDRDDDNMRVRSNRVVSHEKVEEYGLTKIPGTGYYVDIDEAERVKFLRFTNVPDDVYFHWNWLPPQTVMLRLLVGSITSIDFGGIECDHLGEIAIHDMDELTHLNLRGIERCSNLLSLRVAYNKRLNNLNLAPLAGCRKLKELYLDNNALSAELDLRPLTRTASLRILTIYNNDFEEGSELWHQMIGPLQHLTEKEEITDRLVIN